MRRPAKVDSSTVSGAATTPNARPAGCALKDARPATYEGRRRALSTISPVVLNSVVRLPKTFAAVPEFFQCCENVIFVLRVLFHRRPAA